MAGADALLRDLDGITVLSTDVFDTVLLRDGTTETQRLAIASRRAARRLGVDEVGLRQLRWYAQEAAYRAVALADPAGDASLARICALLARTLGLDAAAAQVLQQVEVDVDIEHLRPAARMLQRLDAAHQRGVRVIAVSDTMYSPEDLRRMFAALLPHDPYAAVYTSSHAGATKHVGGLFDAVTSLEGVAPGQVLHVGDNAVADVRNAVRAGWRAVHVPRSSVHRMRLLGGGLAAAPLRHARFR